MAGLSLSVLLFLLFVYFPGNFFMAVASRKQKDRTVSACIYYGSVVLVLVLVFFGCLQRIDKSDVLEKFIISLGAAATGNGQIDLSAVGVMLIASYGLSCLMGFIELFSIMGFFRSKWMILAVNSVCAFKLIRQLSRIFTRVVSFFKGVSSGVQVKPGEPLLETFIRFRRAGKRPLLELRLKDGTVIEGECLRYTWNGKESVLLSGMDDPRELRWLVLEEAVSIRFLNLAALQETAKKCGTEKYLEDVEKSQRILNGLVPGYGDEVYGDILKGLKHS